MRTRKVVVFVGLWVAVLLLLLAIVMTWPPRLGLDFSGGVQLVYAVVREDLQAEQEAELSSDQIDWDGLARSLEERINPSGSKEITILRYGEWQMQIVIPDVDSIEIDRIKKLIGTEGCLEFRIVANPYDHESTIWAAEEQAEDPIHRRSKQVTKDDEIVGFWACVGRGTSEVPGGIRPLRAQVAGDTIRDASTGDIIRLPPTLRYDDEFFLERWMQEEGIEEIEVLMATDDGFDVTGAHLGLVSRGYDEVARPCVKFNMNGQGVELMRALTGSNLPDEHRNFYRRLGIILDGALLSAPRVMSTISDQGQITGQFTQEEVDFLVEILQAGSLPRALTEIPVAEKRFHADEATRQTSGLIVQVTLVILVVICLHMLFRYQLVGLAALSVSLLQIVLVLFGVEYTRVCVTMPLVAVVSGMLVLMALGNTLICESVRRAAYSVTSWTTSRKTDLVRTVVLFAVVIGSLCFASFVAFVVTDTPLREGAFAGGMCGIVATLTSCLGLPYLILHVFTGGRNSPQDAEVITAEIVYPEE